MKRCKPHWSCTAICTRMCMAMWHSSCKKVPANIWHRQHGKMHKKNSNFKMWYTSGTLRQNKSPDSLYLQGFPGFCQLFKLGSVTLKLNGINYGFAYNMPCFYFYYIISIGFLMNCCQNVAMNIISFSALFSNPIY